MFVKFFTKNLILFFLFNIFALYVFVEAADFAKAGLNSHNYFRGKHNVPELTLDDTLNRDAQACADYLAKTGQFGHVCKNKKNQGENLYAVYGGGEGKPSKTVSNAVKAWYDEVSEYDYDNPKFSQQAGHFTQVVWKSTKQLGIGYAHVKKSSYTVVVARYSPPGNYAGKFEENVPERDVARDEDDSDDDEDIDCKIKQV